MTVAAILQGKPERLIGLPDSKSLADAAKLLTQEKIGALVVRNGGGEMIGILSERDIVRAVAKDGPGVLDRAVSTIMTRDVITCDPDDSIERVMQTMTSGRFRHLPVVRHGELLGLISIGDVVKARLEEARYETEALKAYIVAG